LQLLLNHAIIVFIARSNNVVKMQNLVRIALNSLLSLRLNMLFDIDINARVYLDVFYVEDLISRIKFYFDKEVNKSFSLL